MPRRSSAAPIPTPSSRSAAAGAALAAVVLALGLGACGSLGSEGSGGSDATASEPARAEQGAVPADAAGGAAQERDASSMAVEASSGAATATTVAAALAAGAAAPGPGDAGGTGGGAAVPALQPLDIGRSIIFNATVTVEVGSVAAASDQAMTAIGGLGGFLYGQQSTNEPTPSSVLTFKVAPKDFPEALRRLGGIGTVLEQQVSSDDVTDTVVDLQSRIAAAQVSVERLRGFLAEASDVNTLAALERELLARESQLEQLNGQLRGVQAQVDLATITLTLTQPAPDGPALELVVTAYAGSVEGVTSCPGEDELDVAEGEAITLCYEVRNSGDTVLRDLRLDDPGLDIARGDLRVVQGDPAAPLEPGAVVVLAAAKDAPQGAVSMPRVRAVAVGADGEPSRAEVQSSVETPSLSVRPDTSRPGFVDALRTGGRGLASLVSVLVMAAGLLLPFVWVLPLAFGLRVLWRRRRPVRAVPAGPVSPGPAVPAPAAGPVAPGPVAPTGAQPVLVGPAGVQDPAPGGEGGAHPPETTG